MSTDAHPVVYFILPVGVIDQAIQLVQKDCSEKDIPKRWFGFSTFTGPGDITLVQVFSYTHKGEQMLKDVLVQSEVLFLTSYDSKVSWSTLEAYEQD